MTQKILLTFVLSIAFALSASAASYGLYVSTPAQVGSAKLDPGVYTMKVDGNNVTFTESKTKKAAAVTAKEVKKSDTKIQYNEIVGPKADGVQKVTAINIGGYNLQVIFE